MAIAGEGLQFNPLYWRFDDQWKYFLSYPDGSHVDFNHYGHLHFWMMGLDFSSPSGDAFSGSQRYDFDLVDEWGPRSGDVNQSQLYTVVGKPKWFFHVEELWRRVFVQPWDGKVVTTSDPERRGIKYDASPADKTMGPFREGRANHGLKNWVPYWTRNARSLPIDYYTSGTRSQTARQNHLADQARSIMGDDYVDAEYNLQHGNYLPAKRDGGHPAGVPPFSDALYIWPIIEYQKVTQLDWEPLPGTPADVADPNDADANYGDGWSQSLTIPFVDPVLGHYRSPFGTTPGAPFPFGQYNETTFGVAPNQRKLVPVEGRLRYADYTATYADPEHPYAPPLLLPPEQCGQPITEWHNPWGGTADGKIVQQCLGGIVRAKAKVIVEHKLGGRFVFWTNAIEYQPSTPFEGTDQAAPPTS